MSSRLTDLQLKLQDMNRLIIELSNNLQILYDYVDNLQIEKAQKKYQEIAKILKYVNHEMVYIRKVFEELSNTYKSKK